MVTMKQDQHPAGLWILSLAAALCCYCFITINSLLIIIATSQYHISNSHAYLLSGTYNSLLFILPLAGGFLAEKLGYKRALILGTLLQSLGLIFISIYSSYMLILGLASFACGIGFFIPTYLVLVGKLYYKDDKRRESGYTLTYIIINIGFFIGGAASGIITKYTGYQIMFMVALVINLLIFAVYALGNKHIKPIAGRSISPQLHMGPHQAWPILIGCALLLIGLSYLLLEHPISHEIIITALVAIVTISIVWLSINQKKQIARKKLIAFLILSYFSIGFWTLYSLEPSLITLFISTNVNHTFFNYTVPPSTFYALDAFFIILLGLLLSKLWKYLAKIKKNPSLATKFTLSLFSMAAGFLILVIATLISPTHSINIAWIVGCYLLLALAELMISPIGNSMVGSLAPEGMEGRLMGVWQLFIGFSGAASGLLAQLAVIPQAASFSHSQHIYSHAFLEIALLTLVVAMLSLMLIPHIKRLIHIQRITNK